MTTTEKDLRTEWHNLTESLDRLYAAADSKPYLTDDDLTSLYSERNAIHRRISEIVATGVSFDDPCAICTPTRDHNGALCLDHAIARGD